MSIIQNKKRLNMLFIGICSLSLFGIALTQINQLPHSAYSSRGGEQTVYSLKLNSSNAVYSDSEVDQLTDLGNKVKFKYNNVTTASGAHTKLQTNGYLVNKTNIRSISSVVSNFSGTGTLKFKVSYDGETWGNETTMVSDYKYDLGSAPYFIQFTAYTNPVTISSINFTYSCAANPEAAGHQVIDEGSTYYEKVTSTETFSGKYLIVYEAGEAVFNGALGTIDATENYIDATIEDDIIQGSEAIDAAAFTITAKTGGYSIKGKTKYIGNASSTTNQISSDTSDSYVNTISISNGNATIVCNSTYLRFNAASNQLRFRYFKSTSYTNQQAIALYKQHTTQAGSHTEYDTPEDSIIGFTATDSNKDNYKTTDIFDNVNGLTVVANKTGDTSIPLSKGGEDGYSYVVKNSSGTPIDTSKAFGGITNQTFTLVVSYKDFIPQEITLSVGFVRAITSIANVSTSPSVFNTSQKLEGNLSNLTVTLNYNDETSNTVTYGDFNTYGLSVVLLNPSLVTYSQSSAFGTAGTWTIKVVYTNEIFGSTTITVNAIPVESVTLNQSEYSLEEGKTLQLVATVGPNNATNKNVTWSSSAEAVATVDANGLVTAVSAGEAIITARSSADNTKYGSCTITVTAKQTGADEGLFVLNESGAPEVGSYVVIASSNSDSGFAMSKTQNTNNRPGVAVTIDDKTIERDSNSGFAAFRVTEGLTSGSIAFYDEEADGYLYAASSSGNQMRTETTLTDNSSWLVTGSESKTITAQGGNSRNIMRWNTSAQVFSCYGSGQAAPYIYEKSGDPIYATSISISGSSSVSVNGTTQLSVTFNPNNTNVKSVTWETSDDTIAGVDGSGLVTGIKAGNVTITASVKGENNTTVSATKNITVANVAVTSVSLNKATASISVGDTETLVHTISPSNATNKNVTWSTSDNSVATVDGGVVTGVGAGTATITVTTVDGSKTASCTVTVTSSGGSAGADVINNAATTGDLGSTATSTWVDFTLTCTSATYNIHSLGLNHGSHALQWNTNGYLYSTSSDGLITSVEIDAASGKSFGIDLGSSTITSNNGGSEHGSITGSGTYTAVGEYQYIRIYGKSSGTQIYSITINYGSPEPVNPTSIAFGQATYEVAKGGSKSLSVTYTPASANQNKAITWSTSNSSIASVDTSGKVTVANNATLNATATITATLTNLPSIHASCTIKVVDTPNADHTVLIYICGADLESNNSLATGDIQEILKVSGQPSDVNIVIETGGAKSWASTYGISSTYLQRHHVENKQLVTDYPSITYASMGYSSTLQSFLEYGLTNYPADRVGLVLWNHGGGMRGVCYDEKKNDDNLLDYEVKNAVSNALSNKGMAGQKLEWIGYDACLMQVQDIAEMNSTYFNYMVASEESEAGYGWDYDNWVDNLYAKETTPNILKAIVDSFISDNGGTSSSSNDQTLSYLDLSYASAYKTAWENMASQLSSKITTKNKSSFNDLVKSCKYYADEDYTYFGLFDAKDFINKLSNNSTFNPGNEYTNAVLTAHGNLVAYSSKGKGAGNSYGLAMYWSAASDSGKSTYYTSQHTNFANWRSIVSTYGS